MSYIYSAFVTDKLKYIKQLENQVDYCYYIIGSAGNGKNLLMRKIGEYFSGSTYFFCSYDSNSLDGVLVKDKVLILDSIYPHNSLPTVYKVNGEVVNLGSNISIDNSEVNNINLLFNKEKIAKNEYLLYGGLINKYMQVLYDYYSSINLDKIKNQAEKLVNDLTFAYENTIDYNLIYSKEKITDKSKYSINCKDKMLAKYVVTYINMLLNKQDIKHINYYNLYNDNFVEAIETDNIYIGNNLIFGENIEIYGENIIDLGDYGLIESKVNKAKKEALYLHKKLERAYKPFISFDNNDKIINSLITDIKLRLK